MICTLAIVASALSPTLRPRWTAGGGPRRSDVRLAAPGDEIGDAVRRSLDGEQELADLLGKIQAEVSRPSWPPYASSCPMRLPHSPMCPNTLPRALEACPDRTRPNPAYTGPQL